MRKAKARVFFCEKVVKLTMGKRDWTIRDIDLGRDYWLWEAAEVTKINIATLWKWRKERRLCVYPNKDLTRGEWILEAIRDRIEPLSDAEIKRRHRRRWPTKAMARNAVTAARQNGTLIPQPCEICGRTENIEAHHDDYSKLLEVRWLCREHHLWVHRKRKTEPATAGRYRMDRDPTLEVA